jgi:hypothetical protein
MAIEAEIRIRFDRVISAIRGLIDSLIAQEAAWEDLKKGTVGVYADSAMACSNARQAFEDETPTMEALAITLRDNCYKDPTWPADGGDDVKILRLVWCSIHKTIEAGKSFTPDDIDGMRNLCAALERARDSILSNKNPKETGSGRTKGDADDRDGLELDGPLTENDRCIIQAMFRLSARIDNPQSAEVILQSALAQGNNKREFDRLKSFRYVDAKSGRSGGYWLTAKGVALAESLQKRC